MKKLLALASVVGLALSSWGAAATDQHDGRSLMGAAHMLFFLGESSVAPGQERGHTSFTNHDWFNSHLVQRTVRVYYSPQHSYTFTKTVVS